jgi:hypothetical protein
MKQIKERSALAVGAVALGLLLSASTVLAEVVEVNAKGYVTAINNLNVKRQNGKSLKYNVKFRYDTGANIYQKTGFNFNNEANAFLALSAAQNSLNKVMPRPKKAGSVGTKEFFIGIEVERNTFIVGIGAEFLAGIWDDCETECFLATATGKSNENYTWAVFTPVQ